MPAFDDIDDDGAAEVVSDRPRRRVIRPAEVSTIMNAKVGGRTSHGEPARLREAVVVRKAGQPAMRLTLSHLPVFRAVWSAWSARRVAGDDDPGVAMADIDAYLEKTGQAELKTSAPGAIRGLIKAGALRTTDQHVGWAARRTRYYPTEGGVQAFALAETLGRNALVQVGGTAAAWTNRASTAPLTLFEYAALLKGGALPETA